MSLLNTLSTHANSYFRENKWLRNSQKTIKFLHKNSYFKKQKKTAL
jgi:hypothetical protein